MNFIYFFTDSILFVILALTLGYIIDVFIKVPSKNEPLSQSILLLLLQIIIGMIVIYIIDYLFENFNGRSSISFFGLTIFTVLFFLTQQQLLKRITLIYHHIRYILPIKEMVI